LRDALREHEKPRRGLGGDEVGGGGGGKRKRGKRVDESGERVDGRAGPKSEAVVLAKTVDYLRQLLAERQGLLSRLEGYHATARSRGIRIDGGPRIWEDRSDESNILFPPTPTPGDEDDQDGEGDDDDGEEDEEEG